jgi:hypothetical protein
MSSYTITVERPVAPGHKGTLTFEEPGADASKFSTACYWDPDQRIPAGTYTGCSLTMMASKKRDGVFIPNVAGFTGIFIHKGEHLESLKSVKIWSDACILLEPEVMKKVVARIDPRDGRNVTVIVRG